MNVRTDAYNNIKHFGLRKVGGCAKPSTNNSQWFVSGHPVSSFEFHHVLDIMSPGKIQRNYQKCTI